MIEKKKKDTRLAPISSEVARSSRSPPNKINILIILDGLGGGLGHLGHSLRACAEGFWLKRQGYDCEEPREGVEGERKRVSLASCAKLRRVILLYRKVRLVLHSLFVI